VTPSSETETRSRGRSTLDRGGTSRERGRPAPERGGVLLEGASDPRARRKLARGGAQLSIEAEPRGREGVQPPSEAESCSRGRPTLVRDGNSLEGGGTDPRARRICTGRRRIPRVERSSARGWLGR
jgi:hypothetical protein